MKRLTDNDLDALEAAYKAATPGQITLIPNGGIDDDPDERYWALEAGVGHYEGSMTGFRLTGFISSHDASLIALAYYALPALLAELRDLRRLTTPEPISEKHRDGNWWLVWERDYDGWREGIWHKSDKHWVNVYGSPAFGAPTHALPLPGRPEPPAPRGEE
jgi:hypothetical protein